MIDYANVSEEAAEILDRLRLPIAGHDISSVLNRIIVEWADYSGTKR
jgi:hypothetical protein